MSIPYIILRFGVGLKLMEESARNFRIPKLIKLGFWVHKTCRECYDRLSLLYRSRETRILLLGFRHKSFDSLCSREVLDLSIHHYLFLNGRIVASELLLMMKIYRHISTIAYSSKV